MSLIKLEEFETLKTRKIGLMEYSNRYLWKCLRQENCREFSIHDHCIGIKKNGQLCNNRTCLDQYCFRHKNQAKCFIPHCKSKPMNRHNYCFDHINYYMLFRVVVDSTYKHKFDFNIIMLTLSFM